MFRNTFQNIDIPDFIFYVHRAKIRLATQWGKLQRLLKRIPVHAIVQVANADAEQLGGTFSVVIAMMQGGDDCLLFGALDGCGERQGVVGCGGAHFFRQI